MRLWGRRGRYVFIETARQVRSMEPVLQVALDHMHLKRALLAAKEAVDGGAETASVGLDHIKWLGWRRGRMRGNTPLPELKAVAAASSLPVAVAGGLTSETVGQALKAGASIVIVGGAIIKAEDVAGAPRTIKKAILQRKSIPTGLYKKYADADVGEAFRKVSTPNLADAMQKRGVMTGLVPRIKHGTKLVGRAVTVKTADGDWAKPVEAIDRARAGDVIGAGGGDPTPRGNKRRRPPQPRPRTGEGEKDWGRAVAGGRVRALFRNLRAGRVPGARGGDPLRALPYQDLGFAKLDSHRDL